MEDLESTKWRELPVPKIGHFRHAERGVVESKHLYCTIPMLEVSSPIEILRLRYAALSMTEYYH
jgi:hypothetical protein